jgi:DsbC/DsbD-like thiol-disulfide interchange protein
MHGREQARGPAGGIAIPARPALVGFLALIAAAATSPAAAAGTPALSPWVGSDHSAVRLLAGLSTGPTRQAGIEIRLDPGWHTYWKAPGDSGAPPVFDWSASENVAAVAVSFPRPERLADADGVTFGYRDDVILPIRVTPRDPRRPATLAGVIRYAVCGKVCIPVEAKAGLTLTPGAAPDAFAAARLQGFAGRVPQPSTVGATGALAVKAVHLAQAGDHPALVAEVAAPGGAGTMFAAGEGVGVPRRTGPGHWQVPLGDATRHLELVLSDTVAAISVPVALDEMATTP